jgi:hypothetical protein
MLLFFGAYGKQSGHVNSTTMTVQLASQGRKYFKIT